MRNIRIITSPLKTSVGPFTVSQPLPTNALRYADPFLLLHHAGPHRFEPGSEGAKIEEHPHRGFEPVTFVYRGSVLHRDSLGNEGVIGAGEVQWITSGSGIMHEEGPTPEMARDGGEVELIQLWVNLPKAQKMMEPTYQELRSEQIPKVSVLDDHLHLSLVAGEINGVAGPATTQSPLLAAMGTMQVGGSGIVDVTDLPTVVLYLLSGQAKINGEHVVDAQRMVVFDPGEGGFTLEVLEEGNILLLAGEPLNEPVFQYGPFVMSTEEEVREAFKDFAGGKFGTVNS